MTASNYYAICTSMRTGSTLLSTYLMDTKLAGAPVEFANHWQASQFVDYVECSPMSLAFIETMAIYHTTPNGVFGIKLNVWQISDILEQDRFEGLFPIPPKYIHLTRLDKLKQAISAAKAAQTGLWFTGQKLISDDGSPEKGYHPYQIKRFLDRFADEEIAWEAYFERNKINPLRLTYEQLHADPEKVVRAVLEFIGVAIPPDFQLPPARLEKQADQTNDEWEARYTSETA